jgi:signal transduction histidine kinase
LGLWPGTRSAVAAALAGVVVVVAGSLLAQRVQSGTRGLDAAGIALALVATLALAWAPQYPRAVLAVVVAAVAGYLAADYPYGPVQLCLLAAVFLVGRQCAIRASLPACVLATAAVTVALYPRLADDTALHSATGVIAIWTASWLIIPWLVGALLRSGAATLALRRKQLLDEAVWSERMRLARDVHDVAGHGFAVIAMQAGVAMLTGEERPDQALESLQAIRTTSTRALAELRTTLGIFGADRRDGGSPQFGGPVGLRSRLEELVAGMRSAGVEVTLEFDARVEGAADEVIYRVVQESLTNVVRHAGAAPATVTLGREGDELTITVADRGPGSAVASGGSGGSGGLSGSGQGLRGMRERLGALGGSLSTDASPAGFTVSARVPVSVSGRSVV